MARRAGELRVVRLVPAVRDEHLADLAPIRPRCIPAPEVSDRGQHEREARGRCRRVLDHRELRVVAPREIFERGGRRELVLREPGAVVDEADVAVVDRNKPVARVEVVARVDVCESRRRIRVEQLPGERSRHEVVVDAEEDVAFGSPRCKQSAVQRRASVAVLQDPQLQARLLLERGLRRLGDRERVVRHEDDLACSGCGHADACADDRGNSGRCDDDDSPHDVLLS